MFQKQRCGVIVTATKVLKCFNMLENRSVITPMEKNAQVEEQSAATDVKHYQAAIGSLMYLMTRTRPDLCYAVSCCRR